MAEDEGLCAERVFGFSGLISAGDEAEPKALLGLILEEFCDRLLPQPLAGNRLLEDKGKLI